MIQLIKYTFIMMKVSRIYKAYKMGRQKRFRGTFEKVPTIWYPPEIRYKDRFADTVPSFREATPKMLRQYAEYQKSIDEV